MKCKLGLKLWSTNDQQIDAAERLYRDGLFQYIELYAVPGSFRSHISFWKNADIPFVIHAPHFMSGMNLADSACLEKNRALSIEALRFADELLADIIIFHPGVNGAIEETAKQICNLKDSRIVIENKPYYALNDIGICVGSSPSEIKFILENCGIGFCLDVGHAVYAANAVNKDPLGYVFEFMKLNPAICHLFDGDLEGILDQHLNLGKGSFPLKSIINELASDTMVTLETPRSHWNGLKDFEDDVAWYVHHSI